MSSESLIITVAAAVGSAVAALGSVEKQITRVGDASAHLQSRQDALLSSLNGKIGAIEQFRSTKTELDNLSASYTSHQAKTAVLGQELAKARAFQESTTVAFTQFSAELKGQVGGATDAQKLKLKLLREQAQAAEKDVRTLSKAFDLSREKSKALENEVQGTTSRLQSLRTELKANGVETKQLASHHARLKKELTDEQSIITRLGATVEKLNANQAHMSARIQRAGALRQQREQMRSDMMDIAAVGATVIVPIKLAVDFESAMADVRKVVDFETPEQFKQLGNELLELGTRIPIPAAGLAQIAASGGQLGVAAQSLPLFTETIAKMSVAFDMLPEEAGDSMAKLANVYEIPITHIGKLGDAINQLSNESPAKARDIVQTLSRVGGVAKIFGLTEMQTASLTNAFISLGKPPEVAGTAINGMLTKLMTADKQGKDFQSALTQIGYSATGLKQAIGKDAQGALLGFIDTLNQVPKERRMGLLVDLFGREYADDVAVLAGAPKAYKDSVQTIDKKDLSGQSAYYGSMEREFNERAKNTASNLQTLKGYLTQVGVVVGSTVLPAINSVTNETKPMIAQVKTWAEANQPLIAGFVKVVAGLTALKMGSLLTRYSLNLVGSGINNVLLTMSKLNGTRLLFMAARLGDATRFKSALVALGVSAKHADTALTALGKAKGFAHHALIEKGLATKIGNVAKSPFSSIGGAIARGLTPVLALGAPVLAIIGAVAVAGFLVWKYWYPIKAFFSGFWTGLKQGLAPLVPLFYQVAAVAGRMFAPLKPVFGWVMGAVAAVVGWFGKLFTQEQVVGNGAQNMGVRVGQAVGTFITGVVRIHAAVITHFGKIVAWFGDLPAKFVQIGADLVNGLINGITSKVGAAVDAVKGLASRIGSAFRSDPNIQTRSPSRAFFQTGAWVGDGAALGIESKFSRVKAAVVGLAQNIGSVGLPVPQFISQWTRPSAVRQAIDGVKSRMGGTAGLGTNMGGIHIQFSPQITIQGGSGQNIEQQVQKGMQWSLRELESMINRIAEDKLRKAF